MKIFLSGVSCVGKSTIGKILAEQLGHNFFDLEGLGPVESANKVRESLDQFKNKD